MWLGPVQDSKGKSWIFNQFESWLSNHSYDWMNNVSCGGRRMTLTLPELDAMFIKLCQQIAHRTKTHNTSVSTAKKNKCVPLK